MRKIALITIALLSLPVQAGKVTTFNQHCVESESVIASMNARPVKAGEETLNPKLDLIGEVCHYGQLTAEDLSYVESVQPTLAEPLILPVIKGEVCQYGQLTPEDLSFVESVQPANAVRVLRGQN